MGGAPFAVDVRRDHPEGTSAARVLRAAALGFLRALGQPAELSLVVTTDREIRLLNRQWRGKDQATDVLSFPGSPAARRPGRTAGGERRALGDVVISLDTARRQAREGGWSLAVELRRLLAHGLLHCLGHDHETAAEARRMARAEEGLLGREGMVGAALPVEQAPQPGSAPRKRRRS